MFFPYFSIHEKINATALSACLKPLCLQWMALVLFVDILLY